MKQINIYVTLLLCIVLWGCTSKYDKLLKEIKSMEEKIQLQSSPNEMLGDSLLNKYQEFIDLYPDDTLAPSLLYKSARLSLSLGSSSQTKDFLERLLLYEDSGYEADAYVLLGYINEIIFQDIDKAKYWYVRFLSEFPEHSLYEEIKINVEHLGKSPEELVSEFFQQIEENNKRN